MRTSAPKLRFRETMIAVCVASVLFVIGKKAENGRLQIMFSRNQNCSHEVKFKQGAIIESDHRGVALTLVKIERLIL